MTALVTELQTAACDDLRPVSTLLRLALTVGAKLGLNDVETWVRSELNGYVVHTSIEQDIPDYRIVATRLRGVDRFHRWFPIEIGDERVRELISSCPVLQPVGELEHIVARGSDNLTIDVPLVLKQWLWDEHGKNFDVVQHIPRSQIAGIFDGVRSRVLELSLELEKRGIMGEGKSFTPHEKKDAQSIQYNIHNVGVLGNVSDHASVRNTQVAHGNLDLRKVATVLDEIDRHVEHLPASLQAETKGLVSEIRSELTAREPRRDRIRNLLASLRRVAEGAGGGLVATGVINLIGSVL